MAQEETGLVGMNLIYDQFRDRADALIDVLGDGHSISYGALGIHCWRVIAEGPPGHTLRGGMPTWGGARGEPLFSSSSSGRHGMPHNGLAHNLRGPLKRFRPGYNNRRQITRVAFSIVRSR